MGTAGGVAGSAWWSGTVGWEDASAAMGWHACRSKVARGAIGPGGGRLTTARPPKSANGASLWRRFCRWACGGIHLLHAPPPSPPTRSMLPRFPYYVPGHNPPPAYFHHPLTASLTREPRPLTAQPLRQHPSTPQYYAAPTFTAHRRRQRTTVPPQPPPHPKSGHGRHCPSSLPLDHCRRCTHAATAVAAAIVLLPPRPSAAETTMRLPPHHHGHSPTLLPPKQPLQQAQSRPGPLIAAAAALV